MHENLQFKKKGIKEMIVKGELKKRVEEKRKDLQAVTLFGNEM